MIKQLFFPRMLGDKLLFAEKHIGIFIDDTTINVAHINATHASRTLCDLAQIEINPGDPKTYYQRLGAALKRLAPIAAKNPYITVGYPSSKVIIKELAVPFLDPEKIRMVVEYEIEPIIPFNLDEAVIDFIVVDQSEVKNSSTILVAAAPLEEVKRFVTTFEKAGIEPAVVTIDTFCLAYAFSAMPVYQKHKHAYVLVDVGTHSTRIALINNHVLRATRTLNIGHHVAPKKTGAQPSAKTVAAHYATLCSEIAFTLNAFEVKQSAQLKVEQLFVAGEQAVFEALQAYTKQHLYIGCEQFAYQAIETLPGLKNKTNSREHKLKPYMQAISAALLAGPYQDFSLRRKDIQIPQQPLVKKQLITGALLLVAAFLMLGGYGISQRWKLQKHIDTLQKKEVKKLRGIFPQKSPQRKKNALKSILKEAEGFIDEQEEIWAPFAKQRLRPLEILQELTALFNMKKYDLDIELVTISGDDNEPHPIQIIGTFRSKTGSEHFKHFGTLEQDIRNAKMLILTEQIDPTPAQNGVRFVVHMRQRGDR